MYYCGLGKNLNQLWFTCYFFFYFLMLRDCNRISLPQISCVEGWSGRGFVTGSSEVHWLLVA